jgi:UDP-N-acetyl-D-glucosamine dehydrogenase
VEAVSLGEDASLSRVEMTDEVLENADCTVIVTDHTCLDVERIVRHSKVVVDTRNATRLIKDRSKVVLL